VVDTHPAVVAPSSSASIKQYNPKALDWVAPEAQEFLPQTYNSLATVSHVFSVYDIFFCTFLPLRSIANIPRLFYTTRCNAGRSFCFIRISLKCPSSGFGYSRSYPGTLCSLDRWSCLTRALENCQVSQYQNNEYTAQGPQPRRWGFYP